MGDSLGDLRGYLMDYCGTAGPGCGVAAVAGGFGDLENAPGLMDVLDDVEGLHADAADGDAFVVTLSDLNGTSNEPARVTITNAFSENSAPATGIDDNAGIWGTIVAACGVLIFLLLLRHRARL